ncbi:hypothetical protein [Aquabacterium sp.]|uniref:hypothetical protein n=1 Tax=Aquabacterium sp. TaxID=1872578 RepID=UPI002BA2F60A|nr:hypothetical protein [Aquabacterium sp.]HSW06620.1 hypothetical protein [Aquabacterium sp.]
MQATKRIEVPERLRVLVTLAQLLERLEQGAAPVGAGQYRAVAARLAAELAAVPQDPTLEILLGVFPAMAQMYENLRYEQAGLCRSSLDAAAAAEVETRALIGRMASGSPR